MPVRFVTAVLFVLLFFVTPAPVKIRADIPAGADAASVAEQLFSSGVLARKTLFLKTAALLKTDRELKYGSYEFFRFSPVYNVISKLKNGRGVLIKVTIPEGFRTEQIARRLEAKKIVNAEEFLKYVRDNNLDGRLCPETYYFPRDATPAAVCRAFKKQFDAVFTDKLASESKANGGLSPGETVVLASIIEKEAKARDEKFLISGIFHNRLKKRMRLEACSTVRFAMKKWRKPLSIEDTFFKSPFNTYRHYGLPPEPICNPGRISLEAAARPEATDLLFFVLDSRGRHNFSKYFRDHRRKKFRREKEDARK